MPIFDGGGISIFYHDEGQGEPLLLIHGFPLSSDMWEPQRAALMHRFRVIAPDLRGTGKSDVPTGGYSMAAYADDLIALLNELGIAQAIVGGMSMGGYIAFELLRRAPDRVSGLILIDTKATADDEEAKAKRRSLIDQVRSEGSRAAVETEKMFTERTHQETPDLIEFARRIMSAMPADGIVGALEAMIARPESTAMLSEIRVPTLVIVGSHDTLTPPDAARAMQAAIPNAQLVVIDGAAHGSNLERPDDVNKAILDWAGQQAALGARQVG
jgi:pimeloyl-ACP methyl ester carboxylesterase